MNTLAPLAIILGLVALLVAPEAHSRPPHARDSGKTQDTQIERVFTQIERNIVAEFYRGQWDAANRSGTLPPGLAKRDRLPPGLQKQLVKNGRLPPGLDKNPLPNELERLLGAPPKGTQRYTVGSDVILVDLATNVLLDTINGALYPN